MDEIKTMKANVKMNRAGCLRAVVGAALASALLVPACTNETNFAYFNVKVDIDPTTVDDELRRKIDSCSFFVSQDDNDYENLPCTLTKVPYSLGVVDFSTSASRGTLVFTVKMLDLNRQPLAAGSSPPVAIVPNTTTQTAVVAVAVVPKEDAGAPPADGGNADAGAVGDASTDGL